MDTSTPPGCQEEVTDGMGSHVDAIQMLGTKQGDVESRERGEVTPSQSSHRLQIIGE